MRIQAVSQGRSGVTLLEVILATALLVISIGAINELMSTSTDLAARVRDDAIAIRLCQSKLNDFISGAEPISSTGGSFDDEDFADGTSWEWSASTSSGGASGLNLVTVTVTGRTLTNSELTMTMSRYIFDPAQKGRIGTVAPTTTTDPATMGTMSGTTTMP